LLFTKTQTKRRFAICKTVLANGRNYSVRLKKVYDSQLEIEKYANILFDSKTRFTSTYFNLAQLAWGGEYFAYDKTCATEGAFYPFVRTIYNSQRPVDEGCIWIGAVDCYPVIYIANKVANWISPYSKGGFLRTEPFLPYHEAIKILPRLLNKKIYPDLDVEFF
jgi:hypothetical protein